MTWPPYHLCYEKGAGPSQPHVPSLTGHGALSSGASLIESDWSHLGLICQELNSRTPALDVSHLVLV